MTHPSRAQLAKRIDAAVHPGEVLTLRVAVLRRAVRNLWQGLSVLGVLAVVANAGAAHAKPPPKPSPSRPSPPPLEDDGLGPNEVLLQSDEMVDDDHQHTYTAKGNAIARYRGRLVYAHSITYNSDTGETHAVGDVVILNPDKTMEFAQDVELDKDMSTAVALAFSAHEQDNVTITAGAAIRRSENVRELNRAIYTPCKACLANGNATHPTFSIQADRILEDHEHQIVYYTNAIIRVKDIPVFYLPVFWHPDPNAERQSGLLTPKIWFQAKRGVSIEQPYYLVINPSADVIISPQFNARVNPFLNLTYREKFYSGELDFRTGYTFEKNFNSDIKYGTETSRSYFLGKGAFDITPNWSWGFGAERVTDGSMFWRYSLRDIYSDRGELSTDTARLLSQLFTAREDDQSYLSVAALNFQSIRQIGATSLTTGGKTYALPVFESQHGFPTVAPMIDGRLDRWLLGGRFNLDFNTVALTRNDPVVAMVDPSGLQPQGPESVGSALSSPTALTGLRYRNSERTSLSLNWNTTFTSDFGLRVAPFVQARSDFFAISDGERVLVATSGVETALGPAKAQSSEGYETLGANVSYPLFRPLGEKGSIILEPLAQVIISPDVKPNPNIPNEDSTAFEFDESNLFAINKFSGYDLYEGGQRMNLAGRATVDLGDSRTGTFLLGRSFRDHASTLFTPNSGLTSAASDWVAFAQVKPMSFLTLFYRGRLGGDSWTPERTETGLNVSYDRISGFLRYDYNTSGLSYIAEGTGANILYKTVFGKTEDAQAGGSIFLNRNWGLSLNASRDLRNHIFPMAQIGLIYKDDCIRLDLLYTHDQIFQGSGVSALTSESVALRLTLVGFGGAPAIGAPHNDSR